MGQFREVNMGATETCPEGREVRPSWEVSKQDGLWQGCRGDSAPYRVDELVPVLSSLWVVLVPSTASAPCL